MHGESCALGSFLGTSAVGDVEGLGNGGGGGEPRKPMNVKGGRGLSFVLRARRPFPGTRGLSHPLPGHGAHIVAFRAPRQPLPDPFRLFGVAYPLRSLVGWLRRGRHWGCPRRRQSRGGVTTTTPQACPGGRSSVGPFITGGTGQHIAHTASVPLSPKPVDRGKPRGSPRPKKKGNVTCA